MLYVIGDDYGYVKIGIAAIPHDRLRTLQTANPRPLSIYQTWSLGSRAADKAAETSLHWQLGRYRQNGEWFFLSPGGISWLLNRTPADFGGDRSQVVFDDAPVEAAVISTFRLSNRFLAWLDDMAKAESARTEVLERIGALPPAEREAIAQMLSGRWVPQEEPHEFSEMLAWDKDLQAVLRKHPKILHRVENMVQAEQSYLTGNGLPYWIDSGPFFGDTNGPIYDDE